MTTENHNPSEQVKEHDLDDERRPPSRLVEVLKFPSFLAILGAGLAVVLIGHLDVTAAVTLLTALVGLYATYRRS